MFGCTAIAGIRRLRIAKVAARDKYEKKFLPFYGNTKKHASIGKLKAIITMRKFMMTTATLLLLNWASYGAKPIQTKVDKATVYLQGAHLYYQEQVVLQSGSNEIIFENIAPGIIENSLQASSKGGTVMEVQYRSYYKEIKRVERNYGKEIERIKDSIDMLDFDLKDLDNKTYVLETEKKMLLNFKIIKGESTKDSLPLLASAMDFTHQRLNAIYDQSLAIDKRRSKLNKLMQQLNNRLAQLQLLENGAIEDGGHAVPVHQVVVNVYAETAGNAQINFNYFVPSASWTPVYELHANANDQKMQVKYYAMISQQSGINWDQTYLTVSSSNPMELNVKPVLTPWYISLQQFVQMRKQQHLSNAAKPMMAPAKVQSKYKSIQEDLPANSDDAQMQYAESKAMEEYIQMSENLLRVEYDIKLKYQINHAAKPSKVLIKQDQIGMNLEFAAVPKLSSDAYLMANVSGWESLNLLPGNARVYFDNGYIGETFINPQSETDTLAFSLGRDKSLVIQRRKIKEKSRSKILETEKVESRTIEILIRNTKSSAVYINLEDQIPVAQGSNDIKVTLLDGSDAQLEEVEGKLSWRVKVNSKESKKFTFTYEIRYPKDKVLYGL